MHVKELFEKIRTSKREYDTNTIHQVCESIYDKEEYLYCENIYFEKINIPFLLLDNAGIFVFLEYQNYLYKKNILCIREKLSLLDMNTYWFLIDNENIFLVEKDFSLIKINVNDIEKILYGILNHYEFNNISDLLLEKEFNIKLHQTCTDGSLNRIISTLYNSSDFTNESRHDEDGNEYVCKNEKWYQLLNDSGDDTYFTTLFGGFFGLHKIKEKKMGSAIFYMTSAGGCCGLFYVLDLLMMLLGIYHYTDVEYSNDGLSRTKKCIYYRKPEHLLKAWLMFPLSILFSILMISFVYIPLLNCIGVEAAKNAMSYSKENPENAKQTFELLEGFITRYKKW